MTQFIDSLVDIKKNYKPYEEWEQKQQDLTEQKKYLNQKAPLDKFEYDKLKKKAENIIRVSEKMDARSEDNAQDMEMITQNIAGGAIGTIAIANAFITPRLLINSSTKKNIFVNLGVIGFTLVATIAGILWSNTKTKEASRLGRFQAKTKDLQDVKNFVQYTDEQIEEAQKVADKMPTEKKKNSLMKSISNVKEMLKDKKAYNQWKEKNKNKKLTLENTTLSKEQIKQAKADKEMMLSIIKKVNNTAEDYSENTENAFDTLQATSFLATIPIGFGLNKLFNVLKLKIPKIAISAGIAAVFPVAVSLWSVTAEKKASRVGRYQARKEILKNPEILRSFSEEELKQAENIKAKKNKKGFFTKIFDNLKFIPKYFKDSKEYENYLKNERNKKENLNKALLNVKVSKEQLEEAKHLQEKTFMSFDKMDEMSQRYSEDMEAAGEIGKQLVGTVFSILGFAIPLTLGGLFALGKLPTHKIIKFLSKLGLKKDSELRKAIDSAYDVINKDKTLKKSFNKVLSPSNNKQSMQILLTSKEISDLQITGIVKQVISNPSEIENIIKVSLKDGKIAQWVKNLFIETGLLIGKVKKVLNKETIEKIVKEDLKRKNSSNYQTFKTLINTAIVATVPVLSIIIGVPFAFCSWLTNIQKKAGKIGIMKAVKELDDNRLYVNKNKNNQKTETKEAIEKTTQNEIKTQQKEIMKNLLKDSQ